MSFIVTFEGMPNLQAPPRIKAVIPQSVLAVYKPNFNYFDTWRKHHRDHQIQAIKSMQGKNTGQVSLPTGTGKTRVQIDVHVEQMIDMLKHDARGVFAIGAHRLALCQQLLEQLIGVSVNSGIPFNILFVGSARFPEDKIHAEFKNQGFNKYVNSAVSTTLSNEIRGAAQDAAEKRRHLICVSTYHSFDRLKALGGINTCTYDEAHVLVGNDDFSNNLAVVRPNIARNFFFTATRKVQGLTNGMNDKNLFGNVLCDIPPRRLILAGEIVPPKIHVVKTTEIGDYDNHTMLVRTVKEGYAQHRVLVKAATEEPDNIGAKLLITTTGNKELFELHDDDDFRSFCVQNNIKTFAYSSEFGAFVNFEPKSRYDAMKIMCGMKEYEDAIMLHIDVLTEGIDLPSITGVMPFRELNNLKLLQTIGRAGRLIPEDRKRLYEGEYGVPRIVNAQLDGFIKPCSWVIFPELFRSLGNAEAMKSAIRAIIRTYEVPTEEYNVMDRFLANPDDDKGRITPIDTPNRSQRESSLTHLLEDVMIEEANNKGLLTLEGLGRAFGVVN
jgi:superfamily II DNA or RNA helicase